MAASAGCECCMLSEAAWAEVGAAFRRELCRDADAARPRAPLNVQSVGGGPGTDAAGLAWAHDHFCASTGTGRA